MLMLRIRALDYKNSVLLSFVVKIFLISGSLLLKLLFSENIDFLFKIMFHPSLDAGLLEGLPWLLSWLIFYHLF